MKGEKSVFLFKNWLMKRWQIHVNMGMDKPAKSQAYPNVVKKTQFLIWEKQTGEKNSAVRSALHV